MFKHSQAVTDGNASEGGPNEPVGGNDLHSATLQSFPNSIRPDIGSSSLINAGLTDQFFDPNDHCLWAQTQARVSVQQYVLTAIDFSEGRRLTEHIADHR